MNILVFDNYDSFTYNLVHLVEKIIDGKVQVYRNDQLPLEEVKAFDKIILSPGPGIPSEAGMLLPLIQEYAATKSILGVCLGHQAIGEAFGAQLINLKQVFHGVATPVKLHNQNDKPISRLFHSLPPVIEVGRYHSWVIAPETLPEVLQVTATDEAGMIMGIQHTQYDVQGVQFHPESILTPHGEAILRNWLAQ